MLLLFFITLILFPLMVIYVTSRGEFNTYLQPQESRYHLLLLLCYCCAKLLLYIMAGYAAYSVFDMTKGELINGQFESAGTSYFLSAGTIFLVIAIPKLVLSLCMRLGCKWNVLKGELGLMTATFLLTVICIDLGLYPWGPWGVGPT